MNIRQSTESVAVNTMDDSQNLMTAHCPSSSERIIWRLWHAGYLNGTQVTAWDKRRDKVYSITRRMMRERHLPSSATKWEIRSRYFMQKVTA